jgi:hypothetical protein
VVPVRQVLVALGSWTRDGTELEWLLAEGALHLVGLGLGPAVDRDDDHEGRRRLSTESEHGD